MQSGPKGILTFDVFTTLADQPPLGVYALPLGIAGAGTKKCTNQKQHEPKRAQTKKSTNQKQHQPNRAGTKKGTNQKQHESKIARTK